ncbi:oxygen-insensitive NAD(P)H nitroreductase [Xylophilus sp.]|uniref:oxygen-insensitive NAD(P)H nitroreductase n=1 Tax=Xylophilus sp. TaxID=2653893 RepID=UPI0013B8ACAD|nr:oxygen-insensitive NAD(P)H nitroreductase [Xylophilus sp.]KAF1048898.1 MAG: Oxygen-insensitive NAD(P)H nitroreductase [Xylophilus sp.]
MPNPVSLVAFARARHAVKAYAAGQRLDDAQVRELIELARLAPSSVNSQPWHFTIAGDEAARARIAKATTGSYAANEPKVRDASHVIVLAARADRFAEHFAAVLAQEAQDGRFQDAAARAAQDKGRQFYVAQHRFDRKDEPQWLEKQVYLALGTLLLGASAAGIDATPIEGFDSRALDAELGLRERGYTSLVLVALGRRGDGDFNAGLPKSRLPLDKVATFL